jgi:ADP-heptose:LPS heptosyltransferase
VFLKDRDRKEVFLKAVDSAKIKRVLVVMLGGIGNMVQMFPCLRALRSALPGATIHLLVGEPSVRALVEGQGLVDQVILTDRRKRQSLGEKARLLSGLRAEKYDACLMASEMNPFKGSVLARWAGIPVSVGENKAGMGWGYSHKLSYSAKEHAVDVNLRLLKPLGIDAGDDQSVMAISADEKVRAVSFLRTRGVGPEDLLVGIHAGSGSRYREIKRWPQERFAEVADRLMVDLHAKVVFTGGADEVTLVENVIGRMKVRPINAAGQLGLGETGALIQECDQFISNDSGIAHIAAAVGTPLVVLFGPTNLDKIAPRGPRVRLLYTKERDVRCIQRDDVLDAVKKTLSWMDR